MPDLHILNNKEIKLILAQLKEQFCYNGKPNFALLRSEDNKLFASNKDITFLDIPIDSTGLFLARIIKNDLLLSIEGSQLIGPNSTKNIISLNKDQAQAWFMGQDLDYNVADGIYLLKLENDFIGCCKINNNQIINNVPMNRRMNII